MPARAALITGGTSGIGRATALLLHRQGLQVMVTGQNPDTLDAARAALPAEVIVVRADARSLADADRVVSQVREHLETLDVVFLNAGISRLRPLQDVDEATYDDLFEVNVKGQYFTLQKALPLLNHGAAVIFNVGIGATRGIARQSATAATKGALLALVPSLAIELAPRRIRVNAVSPGPVDTGVYGKRGLSDEAMQQVVEATVLRVPLGRFATGDEVAQVVAFLTSDAASFITGENIVVGGGVGLSA